MSKQRFAFSSSGTANNAVKMGVFDGTVAWFSETVKDGYKLLWKAHGGETGDAEEADYLFAMTEDSRDVQEVSRRLENRGRIFLCPRYIVRCILIGRFGAPTKHHILGSELPPANSEQPQVDDEASASGPSQSTAPMCITDMDADFRVHLKPNASHDVCEALVEKLLVDVNETDDSD